MILRVRRDSSRDYASRAVVEVRAPDLLQADTLEFLCRAAEHLRRQGVRLVVVCDDGRTRRLLSLMGFARRFELASGVGNDLAAA
jgi:hypothetical protein